MKKRMAALLALFILSGCSQTAANPTVNPTSEPTTQATAEPTFFVADEIVESCESWQDLAAAIYGSGIEATYQADENDAMILTVRIGSVDDTDRFMAASAFLIIHTYMHEGEWGESFGPMDGIRVEFPQGAISAQRVEEDSDYPYGAGTLLFVMEGTAGEQAPRECYDRHFIELSIERSQ